MRGWDDKESGDCLTQKLLKGSSGTSAAASSGDDSAASDDDYPF